MNITCVQQDIEQKSQKKVYKFVENKKAKIIYDLIKQQKKQKKQKKLNKMGLTQQQIGLLVLGIITLITYLVFMLKYILRIIQLDKLASNAMLIDKNLKIRIGCISILIGLQLIHIIVSFTDTDYYMYQYRKYTFVNILGLIDFILQLYIITRQYKKKTFRTKSVVMLWIIVAVEQLITVIIIENFYKNSTIILPIIQVIVTIVLIGLTCWLKTQDIPFDILIQSMKTKLLNSQIDSSIKYAKNNQRIYVEFNKQFQISLQKNKYQYSFKIAVYVFGKFNIITKTIPQFIQLQNQLKQIFPDDDFFNQRRQSRSTHNANIIQFVQDKQKIYQTFLTNLTKDQKYYIQPLMTFLQINQNQKILLDKHKKQIQCKSNQSFQQQQKSKKPFFIVKQKDHKIHVSNTQILDFYINKTVNEIVAFHNKLIAQKKLTIQLLSQNPENKQIMHFIDRAVNSKYLWKDFAQWMSLGMITSQKIYSMFRFWNKGFDNLQMSVIGFQTSFDQNNSMAYYYLLSINTNNLKDGIMLKKRFNDFVKLDANIKKFITTQHRKNVHIPSLPPRFSPFQSKTSPNFRRLYFDAYMKDIIKIQGINHCIKLLQFLDVHKISSQSLRRGSQLSVEDDKYNGGKVMDKIEGNQVQIQPNLFQIISQA